MPNAPNAEQGPPMTLGNMRKQDVTRLIASCPNDACRHQATIEVRSYPADTKIAYFRRRVACAKCGARGNRLDVRPNWKEASRSPRFLRWNRTKSSIVFPTLRTYSARLS